MSDQPIRLADVTADNCRAVMLLSVADHQQDFVAPNAASIAQSKFFPHYACRAIYRGDAPVGFAMYGPLEPKTGPHDLSITRLMVDRRWQRQGIGREALRLLLEEIRARRPERVTIYYEPENEVAKRLYAGFGFVEVGEDEDEIVAELRS